MRIPLEFLYTFAIYFFYVYLIPFARNNRLTQKGNLKSPSGRLIGYARVSTDDQNLRSQVRALKEHGVAARLIFTDKASGARTERSGLDACLTTLEKGDVLIVWRLDRLGRSLKHLIEIVEHLQGRGVGLRSLQDGVIDTTSASGQLIFAMFSALAQFERNLISERTRAGLAATRKRGRAGGRKPMSPDDPRVVTAVAVHQNKQINISEYCRKQGISRATYYKRLQRAQQGK